jgi:hypothetical protein
MKFIRILVISLLLALPARSTAFWHGTPSISVNSALSGIVGFDVLIPFVNLMKYSITNFTNSSTTFIYPNFLQQGTNLPTGTLPTKLAYFVPLPSNYFGEYVLKVAGTISGTGINLSFAGAWGQVYSLQSGTTITGCTNSNVPPCFFSNGLNIAGTNPQLTLDFSSPVLGASNNGSGLVRLTVPSSGNYANNQKVTVSGVFGSDGNGCGANGQFTLANVTATTVDLTGSTFPGGCTYTSGGQLFDYQSGQTFQQPFGFNSSTTYTNFTSMIMCKLADYTADNTCNTQAGKTAWAGGFSDDFVTAIATLRPHHIRFLDANSNVFRVGPDWNGYPTTSAFSYDMPLSFWAMTNWFGSATGTNSYSISCSSPCTYSLTGGVPADGDFFHFYNVNANTSATATLAITDINSTTSAAIPLLTESSERVSMKLSGTLVSGDTVAVQFNSTSLGAYTCLPSGTHTTTPYTVTGTDTLNTLGAQLAAIIAADTTLTSQPNSIISGNAGNGNISYDYASNACTITASLVVTGTGTEAAAIGTIPVGTLAANTLYTGLYSALHKAIIVNTNDKGGVSGAFPYSVQVALANDVTTKLGLQVGCWVQANLLWSNASFTSLVNYLAANQCPGETILELGNELFNSSNSITGEAGSLAISLGLRNGGTGDFMAYYLLRQRQLWAIASSAFGGLSGNLWPVSMYGLTDINANELAGTTLCGQSGCANGNFAYDNAIGVNYNLAPNRPVDFIRAVGQAPYYQGAILGGTTPGYSGSGGYATWSATSSSVASNILTVSGTVTGTIFWNQGISSCDGVYIAASNASNPTTAQLSGTVTTTLNGAVGDNSTTWTLTSTSGLSAGMWIYDSTTGMLNGTISSVNSGANQISVTGGKKTYRSLGSNDTIVFGGLAGTYQLNSTTCSASSGTITGGDVLGLQYAADNYNSLNSALGSQQDALNWVYQDVLVGAFNNELQPTVTVRSMVNAYNIINGVATTYSLPVWDYEGGYQAVPPSTGSATSMGLPSSAYGGNTGYIGVLQTAFKNSSLFKTLEMTRHSNELALLPPNSMTMWYVFAGGGGAWPLYPGDLSSTPFQSYNAICDYNGGSC